MSSVDLVYKTLSGSAELPAASAAFFFPKQPPRKVATITTSHNVRVCLNNFASSLLCQCSAGHLPQGPDSCCSIGGMKNRSARNQNFGAGSDQFRDILRTN